MIIENVNMYKTDYTQYLPASDSDCVSPLGGRSDIGQLVSLPVC